MTDYCQFCEKETYVADDNTEPVICKKCNDEFYAPMIEDMDEVERTFLNLTNAGRHYND